MDEMARCRKELRALEAAHQGNPFAFPREGKVEKSLIADDTICVRRIVDGNFYREDPGHGFPIAEFWAVLKIQEMSREYGILISRARILREIRKYAGTLSYHLPQNRENVIACSHGATRETRDSTPVCSNTLPWIIVSSFHFICPACTRDRIEVEDHRITYPGRFPEYCWDCRSAARLSKLLRLKWLDEGLPRIIKQRLSGISKDVGEIKRKIAELEQERTNQCTV